MTNSLNRKRQIKGASMNNPPAFPDWTKDGMTLRDYFAAKAMQAVITGYATQNKVDSYSDYWAGFAYEMADAMMKAREQ